MARRPAPAPTPHREFFRAVAIDETVALACTCSRGVDHWYAEPKGARPEGTRLGARVGNKATPNSGEPKLGLRAPRRAAERAGLFW